MNWYLDVLKKYMVFDGRATRSEYWYFVLFNIIISMVLGGIDFITGTLDMETGVGLLSGLYSLFILLPMLAVSIRRLHDTGRSGWWFFIQIIPIIGTIAYLIFMVQDSQFDSNQYGVNPKTK
jgi:uncharacterized membrane protein YhaH (DUF805 family)